MRYPLLLSLVLACVFGPAARAADPVPADPAAAVAAVIADLEAPDFKTRAAAAERLKRLGPEVVPALRKYLDHDDPEIAARVRDVIGSFGWMRQGAIIGTVEDGSLAQKLEIRTGDVVVKIDDFDVNSHTDLDKAADGKADYTLYLWRAGQVRELKVPNQKLGIWSSNWDIDKGGNDHARGLAALGETPPDHAEAYRRLRAARDKGMSDSHTLGILAGLAARDLDRAYAAEVYRAHRGDSTNCGLTHSGYAGWWSWDEASHFVPFDSPHTEWLLGRYKAEPFTDKLYHELEDWFARNGKNGPMAAELLAKPWPKGADDGNESHHYYHDLARIHVWLDQRRYDDVLAVWDARTVPAHEGRVTPYLAIQAAVRGGHPAAAMRIAQDLLSPVGDGTKGLPELAAFALAAAAGEDRLADDYLAAAGRAGPKKVLDWMLTQRSADGLDQPAAAARVRAWLATRPPAAEPGRLERVALGRLVADPAATAGEFAAMTKGWPVSSLPPDLRATYLTGLLRFGRYDEVLAAAPAAIQSNLQTRQAAEFAKANATALAGPWKEAAGLVQVAPGSRAGITWALRYDGQVFRLAASSAKRFEGLAPPPAPVTAAYWHLRVTPESIAVLYPYGRTRLEASSDGCPDMTYVLDEKRGRWVPVAEWEGTFDLGNGRATATGLAERAVAKGYPALPGGTPREYFRLFPDSYFWFEGDVLIYVHPTSEDVTDISSEIGRLAGHPGPARVYRFDPPAAGRPLIFSDCGVWTFDPAAGKPRRVPLGLADENVITSRLPEWLYGKRADGTVLVGVAPQQGGGVFVVNPATLAVTPTHGYCGLGPDDWYAHRKDHWSKFDPQVSIHAQYLARLAAKGK